MSNIELPSSWISVMLGDICSTSSGGTPLRSQNRYYEGSIPWIKSGELEDDLILNSEERISQEGLENSSAKIYPKGTVLVALYGATVGRTGILGVDAATNQAICAIFNDERVLDKMYLFYFLRSERKNLLRQAFGQAQRNISQRIVRATRIPLAPLAEQKRIVAKVESLFVESQVIREALDKAPILVRRFRQSVLFKAFKGRLVVQDPNDEPTKKLFERIRRERRNKREETLRAKRKSPRVHKYKEPMPIDAEGLPGLPEGWIWTNIGSIAENHDSQRIPVKASDRKKIAGEFPYYGASGIIDYVNSYLFDGEYLLISEDGANLFSRSTPIAFIASGKFWVNNHAHVVTIWGKIPLRYVEAYLNSIDLSKWITGTAQPKLTRRRMDTIPIPLAPFAEQIRIVDKIEESFSLIDKIEKSFEVSRRQVAMIDQSVLSKAFSGGLVAQDPNDEPAATLLHRIKVDTARIRVRARKKKRKLPHSSMARQTTAKPVKSIRTILEEIGEAPVEEIFRASGLSMSDFWDELKAEIDAGMIERRLKGNTIFLKVKS